MSVDTINGLARADADTFTGKPSADVDTWNALDATSGGSGVTASDDFNRGDSDPMTLNMSDGISVWKFCTGYMGHPRILSNQLTRYTLDGHENICLVDTPSFSANQSMATIVGAGSSDVASPCVRCQNDGSCYVLQANSGAMIISKIVDNAGASITYTSIGSLITGLTITTGSVLKLSISGTTITSYLDGVLQDTATDSTFSTGQPAIEFEFGETSRVESSVAIELP